VQAANCARVHGPSIRLLTRRGVATDHRPHYKKWCDITGSFATSIHWRTSANSWDDATAGFWLQVADEILPDRPLTTAGSRHSQSDDGRYHARALWSKSGFFGVFGPKRPAGRVWRRLKKCCRLSQSAGGLCDAVHSMDKLNDVRGLSGPVRNDKPELPQRVETNYCGIRLLHPLKIFHL